MAEVNSTPIVTDFAAAVKGRSLPGGLWVLKGRSTRELDAVAATPSADGGVTLQLAGQPLRLFHPVPPSGGRRLVWTMAGMPLIPVSLQSRSPETGTWRSLLGLPLPAGSCRLDMPPCLPEGLLALVLEWPAGSRAELGPVQAQALPPLPVDIPMRNIAAPTLLRLAATNDAFASLAAADLLAALRAELDVCRRLGLFDRVAALHRALQTRAPGLAWTKTELRSLCQSWVVLGETERLRETLAIRPDLVAREDELFALQAGLAVTAGAAAEAFARLPSGQPNYALAASHPALAAILAPALLTLVVPPPAVPAADALLVANAFCGRDTGIWLAWLQAFFAAHDLPGLRLATGPEPAALRLHFPLPIVTRRADHPSISVVMSAFNAAATVDRAIASMLEQSLQTVELLICDDVSSDGTLERLRRYVGHPRVRVFRSLANQGTYNIRNALLPLASGHYASFQDSDDYSHPRRLEWQLARLAEGQSCVASVTGHIRVRPGGQVAVFANQRAERVAPVTCLAERQAYMVTGLFRRVLIGADSESLERLREKFGSGAVAEDTRPLLLAFWSSSSLTLQSAVAQTADGYVAPGRRAYREACILRRLLGPAVMTDAAIDAVTQTAGLFRDATGVEELRGG